MKRIMPLRMEHLVWLAFLIAASVAFSLGFACATPLAAFGAISAVTLSRSNALLCTGAAWLTNQIVGYGVLGYPLTVSSFAWGAAIGIAALAAALSPSLAASWIDTRTARGKFSKLIAPAVAFIFAFAAYEGTLFMAAWTVLGGTESFSTQVVARIFEVNALALIGFLLLSRIAAYAQNLKLQHWQGFRARLQA